MKNFLGKQNLQKVLKFMKGGLFTKEDQMNELTGNHVDNLWKYGEVNPNFLIAPEGELDKWKYEISENNVLLSIMKTDNVLSEENLIIYDYYIKDGVKYKTDLKDMNYISKFHGLPINSYPVAKTVKFGDYIDFSTRSLTIMSQFFYMMYDLTNIEGLERFDTSKITDMSNMFGHCRSLTSLDLSNFNTSKVRDLSYMFNNCSSLTSLDLTSFDTHNVTEMENMFKNCTNLTEIKVSRSKWVINDNCNTTDMFTGCGVDHVTYVD